jgi:hypothetical protein
MTVQDVLNRWNKAAARRTDPQQARDVRNRLLNEDNEGGAVERASIDEQSRRQSLMTGGSKPNRYMSG